MEVRSLPEAARRARTVRAAIRRPRNRPPAAVITALAACAMMSDAVPAQPVIPQYGRDRPFHVQGGCELDQRGKYTRGFPDRYLDAGETLVYRVVFDSPAAQTLAAPVVTLRAVDVDADSPASCAPVGMGCPDPARSNNPINSDLTVLGATKPIAPLLPGDRASVFFLVRVPGSLTGTPKVELVVDLTDPTLPTQAVQVSRHVLNADESSSFYSTDFPLGGAAERDHDNDEVISAGPLTDAMNPDLDYRFESLTFSDFTATGRNFSIMSPWFFDTDHGGFRSGIGAVTDDDLITDVIALWGEDKDFDGVLDGVCALDGVTPCQGAADPVCVPLGSAQCVADEDRDPVNGLLDRGWSTAGGCGWQTRAPGTCSNDAARHCYFDGHCVSPGVCSGPPPATGGAWHTGRIDVPPLAVCLTTGATVGQCQAYEVISGDTGQKQWFELLVTPTLEKVNQQVDLDGDPVAQVELTRWAWNMAVDLPDSLASLTWEFDNDLTDLSDLTDDLDVLGSVDGPLGAVSESGPPALGGLPMLAPLDGGGMSANGTVGGNRIGQNSCYFEGAGTIPAGNLPALAFARPPDDDIDQDSDVLTDEYVTTYGALRNMDITKAGGPDLRFELLEDRIGDAGTDLAGAVGLLLKEGTAALSPTPGFGVTIDDMVIEWREYTLVEDAVDCGASPSCALIALDRRVGPLGGNQAIVTVVDVLPSANDCNGDGDTTDIGQCIACDAVPCSETGNACTDVSDCIGGDFCGADPDFADDTDCDNDGTADVVAELTSSFEPAGERVVLNLADAVNSIYRGTLRMSRFADAPGVLYVDANDTEVTATYEDRDHDGVGTRCPNSVVAADEGFVSDSVELVFQPWVEQAAPAHNELAVPLGANVTVIFSEAMEPSTVDDTTVRLLDPTGTPVAAFVALAPNGRTATLDPVPVSGTLDPLTTYTVSVSGPTNLQGMPLPPFTSLFRTRGGPLTGIPVSSRGHPTLLPLPPAPPPAPPGAASTAALLGGTPTGDNLGLSVAPAGRLGGSSDAYADFLGGAPGYAGGGANAGAAVVCLGSAVQAEREQVDIVFVGEAAGDLAGAAVAGNFDLDADGTPDLLVGAPGAPGADEATGAGRVYLIYYDTAFDTAAAPDYIDLERVANSGHTEGEIPGAVLTGSGSGSEAGFSLAASGSGAGTVLLVGAPGANGGDGRVYLLPDAATLSGCTASTPCSLDDAGFAPQIFTGSSGERLGAAIALPGDVIDPSPGDDVVIGAPLAAPGGVPDAGAVYVGPIDDMAGTVAASTLPFRVEGVQACEQLGYSVAGGGDSRAETTRTDPDILMGAPGYELGLTAPCPAGDPARHGRVAHTTGRLPSAASPVVVPLDRVGDATWTPQPVDGVLWQANQASGLGWWVAFVGDVSPRGGDSLAEVAFGAPFFDTVTADVGGVYLIEGEAFPDSEDSERFLEDVDINLLGQNIAGALLLGEQFEENAGIASAAAGNIDGDGTGYDDFITGAPGWNRCDGGLLDGEPCLDTVGHTDCDGGTCRPDAGTVHQVLEVNVPPPGRCDEDGCFLVDLSTGATLDVPPDTLPAGDVAFLSVKGLPLSLECPNTLEQSGRKLTLAGVAEYKRADCEPCSAGFGSAVVDVQIPTLAEFEYLLQDDDQLEIRYCDASGSGGWSPLVTGPTTGTVEPNDFVTGRKAVTVLDLDELYVFGTFFDDEDFDNVGDVCDCEPHDAALGAPPQRIADLVLDRDPASGDTTLTWGVVETLDGSSDPVQYDVLRASSAKDFGPAVADPTAVQTCTAADLADTDGDGLVSTTDGSGDPEPGAGVYYVVAAQNGCGTNTPPATCTAGDNAGRTVRDCP